MNQHAKRIDKLQHDYLECIYSVDVPFGVVGPIRRALETEERKCLALRCIHTRLITNEEEPA